MSQLAAERPRPASNKPSLGGLIKSSLLYAVLSAIPSAKRTVTDANSLANFANYDATYGSLGAAIGMTIWMWMSSVVILLGAELNSEIEHQTAHDPTTGHERPLGQRGAAMADTAGRTT